MFGHSEFSNERRNIKGYNFGQTPKTRLMGSCRKPQEVARELFCTVSRGFNHDTTSEIIFPNASVACHTLLFYQAQNHRSWCFRKSYVSQLGFKTFDVAPSSLSLLLACLLKYFQTKYVIFELGVEHMNVWPSKEELPPSYPLSSHCNQQCRVKTV